MRSSFIVYSDWGEAFRSMPDELAGQLIKAVFTYQADGTTPETSSPIYPYFAMFRPMLDRDSKKYEDKVESAKRARKAKTILKSECNQDETKSVNVNVNVNDNVNVKDLKRTRPHFGDFHQNEYDFEQVAKKVISNGG